MNTKGALILIFVIALAFRVVGISHGFPFIFHPDEPTIVRSALSVRFFSNPGHFDWPHLYIYANYFGYMGFALIRDIIHSSSLDTFFRANLPIIFNDSLIFYLLTRVFTAFLGALTVFPVYLIGKKLFSERAGLLGALTLALLPFHIRQSHYTMPDIPMIFLFTISLYFATKVFLYGKLQDYLLAGLFSGFAASTKYNGALVILSILFAHFLHNKISFKNFGYLVLAGFFSVCGFIIGTPFSVLDYKTFIRTDSPVGALWQFTNVGSRGFIDRLFNLFDIVFFKIPDDLGYVVLIIFFVLSSYLVFKLIRKETRSLVDFNNLAFVIFPAILFIFYISGLEKSRSHYLLIIHPYLAVVSGYFLNRVMELTAVRTSFLSYLSAPVLLSPVFFFAMLTSFGFYNGDTRVDFYNWAKKNFNSQFPVVYVDSSADVIVKSFAKNRYKAKNINSILPEGYLYSQDQNFMENELILKTRVLNLLYDSGDVYKNGPRIKFYSYSL
jgi:hypothetical protein